MASYPVSLRQLIITLLSAFTVMTGLHASDALIKCSAYYLERIALPQNAIFEASLEDVSVADAPSKTLGSITIDPAGQVPITFEIPYESSDIQKRHRYNIRAKITVDGRLIYITDTAHPVLRHPDDSEVRVKMKRIEQREVTAANTSIDIELTDLPLHFLGTLPGANCRTHYQLDLLANNAYIIATTCIKDEIQEAKTHYDIGRWHLDKTKSLLTLQGGREAPLLFSVLDQTTIRKHDIHGKPIISELDYDLKVSKTAPMLEPELFMMGIYDGTTGHLKECLTGIKMPVLDEGDFGDLDAAYDEARREGAVDLKVHLEASIVQRHSSSSASDTQASLIVKRFIKSLPKEHCSNPYVNASLQNTYWRLTMLNAVALKSDIPIRREAHLIFRTSKDKSSRVSGSTGCNSVNGAYKVNGTAIEISGSKMAMTKMACPPGNIEAEFTTVLEKVRHWKIKGDHLELYGEDEEHLLARFEATYLY